MGTRIALSPDRAVSLSNREPRRLKNDFTNDSQLLDRRSTVDTILDPDLAIGCIALRVSTWSAVGRMAPLGLQLRVVAKRSVWHIVQFLLRNSDSPHDALVLDYWGH